MMRLTLSILAFTFFQCIYPGYSLKLIIDTDPGNDDAVALGIACAARGVDILAVTAVPGNAVIDKTTTNSLEILQIFDRHDIPVYKGASGPIITWQNYGTTWFGQDGLCDAVKINPDRKQLRGGNAIEAINTLASALPGQITFVALGPLTNLALALRFNPDLSKQLKEIIIMGGAVTAESSPEFNFASDPMAAHIVLKEMSTRKYLVPFEMSGEKHYTPIDVVKEYYSSNTKKSIFMKAIMHGYAKIHGEFSVTFFDAVAMAITLERSAIKKLTHAHVEVDVNPGNTAGTCHITENGKKNVYLVDAIDYMVYRKMFLDSVQ